jgi:hypothetical protein
VAQTITTEQAPSAKPNNISLVLTTAFQDLITVNNYDIPIVGLGGQRRIAPGVAEITSPIILTNATIVPATVSVRIVRAGINNFAIANEIPIEPNDIVYIPLNGQFLLSDLANPPVTGDKLQIRASVSNIITATISFTQGQAEENDPFGDN